MTQDKQALKLKLRVIIITIAVIVAAGLLSKAGGCVSKYNEKVARWERANPATYKLGDLVRAKLKDNRLLVDRIVSSGMRWRYRCKYITGTGNYKRETWTYLWEHEIMGLWEEPE